MNKKCHKMLSQVTLCVLAINLVADVHGFRPIPGPSFLPPDAFMSRMGGAYSIESYEDSSMSDSSEVQGRDGFTVFNRDQCLARLLCGISVGADNPLRKKNGLYSDYATLIAKFFEVFPSNDEISAETWEAYEDYSFEPEIVAHVTAPKKEIALAATSTTTSSTTTTTTTTAAPKTLNESSNKRKRKRKNRPKRKKENEKLGIFHDILKPKKKSNEVVEDVPGVNFKFNSRRINSKFNERMSRARKIVANLGTKLRTIKQCRRIKGCPFTFKQLKDKLDVKVGVQSNIPVWGYSKPAKTKGSISYKNPGSAVLSFQDPSYGDDELEEIFGAPKLKLKKKKPSWGTTSSKVGSLEGGIPYSAVFGSGSKQKEKVVEETQSVYQKPHGSPPIILIGNENVDDLHVFQGSLEDLDESVKNHIKTIAEGQQGDENDDENISDYSESDEDDYYDDSEGDEDYSEESSEERISYKKDKKKEEKNEEDFEQDFGIKSVSVEEAIEDLVQKGSYDDEAVEYGHFPLNLLNSQSGSSNKKYSVKGKDKRQKQSYKRPQNKYKRKNNKNKKRPASSESSSEEERSDERRRSDITQKQESLTAIGGRPLGPKSDSISNASPSKTSGNGLLNFKFNFGNGLFKSGIKSKNSQTYIPSNITPQGVKKDTIKPTTTSVFSTIKELTSFGGLFRRPDKKTIPGQPRPSQYRDPNPSYHPRPDLTLAAKPTPKFTSNPHLKQPMLGPENDSPQPQPPITANQFRRPPVGPESAYFRRPNPPPPQPKQQNIRRGSKRPSPEKPSGSSRPRPPFYGSPGPQRPSESRPVPMRPGPYRPNRSGLRPIPGFSSMPTHFQDRRYPPMF